MMARPEPQPADRPRIQKVTEQHPVETRANGGTTTAAAPQSPRPPAQQPQLRPLGTRVTEEIHERLRLAAFQQRVSVQQIVIDALDAYLPPLPPA
ncbi:MAG TPA: hypothetical protein VGJ44_08780 [Kribbellaceae bacterium]|jgi:hypothetical protein